MAYTLDFSRLDDLALASAEQIRNSHLELDATSLGPAIEYELISLSNATLPPLTAVSTSPLAQSVVSTTRNPSFVLSNSSIHSSGVEIAHIPAMPDNNLYWSAFKRRMAHAGVEAGFDELTAKGFVGAFGEMVANAREHSQHVASVIVGYQASNNEFEFVVADAGIGVLASLKSCSEYANLKDHAQALRVALAYGESRYGRNSGRGTGFDTVFRNIATFSGKLRFRSGDQSLVIEGKSPILAQARVQQRAPYTGFLVSVSCHN